MDDKQLLNPYRASAPVELTYYANRKRPWYRPRWSLKGMILTMLAVALSARLSVYTWPWLADLDPVSVWKVFLGSLAGCAALVALLAGLVLTKRRMRWK